MKLDNPAPYALYLLNSFYAAPLHKPSFEKFGKDFIKPTYIVSNGPYHMTESVPLSHVTVVKNPNYWNAAKVKIDKVIFKVTEDDNTAVKLFKSGGLDITAQIPSEQIEPLRAAFGDQVHVTNSTETLYLSFNLKKKPFDDIRVRQALSMAIDRDALINKVIKGGHILNCDFVIPIPGYDGPKLPECAMAKEERIATAKALLAEAGYGPGKQLLTATIESMTSDANKKMAETIAVMWKQTLGIDAKVNAQDRDAWLATFNAGNWDVFGDDLVGGRARNLPRLYGSSRGGRLPLGKQGLRGPL
jgi:oligopeptide transport system substrate-binding protein